MVTVAVLRAAPPPPGAVQVQGGSIAANFVKGATSRKKGQKRGIFQEEKGVKRGKKKGFPYFQTQSTSFLVVSDQLQQGFPYFQMQSKGFSVVLYKFRQKIGNFAKNPFKRGMPF